MNHGTASEIAHALVLDLDRGRELDLEVDYCSDETLRRVARRLASSLDFEHDPAAVLMARELAQALGLTLDRVLRYNLNRLVHGDDLDDGTIDVGALLVVVLERARLRVAHLLTPHATIVEDEAAMSAWRPARISRRLVQQVVRALPPEHRSRYDEELRAELTEIAQTNGRWTQLIYAVRLVGRAIGLRRALRVAAPAAPLRELP